jgi:hypothetical protein
MEKIFAHFSDAFCFTLDFNHPAWQEANEIRIDREWDGAPAPAELQTTARILWSAEELLLGFECHYTELDMDEVFVVDDERYALWDRDVCELFLRSPIEPHTDSYREFEIAPTGQWCDLLIDRSIQKKDWEWKSGMRTAASIHPADNIWRAIMAIPFAAFGCRPSAGDIWHGNLFRISRLQGERRYMTLSPTLTEKPNFHIPDRFLGLEFVSREKTGNF